MSIIKAILAFFQRTIFKPYSVGTRTDQSACFSRFPEQESCPSRDEAKEEVKKENTTSHIIGFNLNDGQLKALQSMRHGRLVFLTGEAGTGKSTVVNEFIKKSSTDIAVAAPTGIAALNVNGSTLHRLFKLPIGTITEELLEENKLGSKAKKIIKSIDRLIIDEVSMCRSDILWAVDLRFREAMGKKYDGKVFGGKSVVMVGDFAQLPPVVSSDAERQYLFSKFGGFFAFNAPSWSGIDMVRLTKQMRQDDNDFIQALNMIRQGDTYCLDYINKRVGIEHSPDTVHLCTTNGHVNTINSERLSEINTKEYTFRAEISGRVSENEYPLPKETRLKVEARVMLIANCYEKDGSTLYVNGDAGKVKEICNNEVVVRLDRGVTVQVQQYIWEMYEYIYDDNEGKLKQNVRGSFKALPIRLYWASTVHKAQGKTLDEAVLNLGNVFAPGQTYVALSRLRSLDGLYLKRPIKPSDVFIDKSVFPWL